MSEDDYLTGCRFLGEPAGYVLSPIMVQRGNWVVEEYGGPVRGGAKLCEESRNRQRAGLALAYDTWKLDARCAL